MSVFSLEEIRKGIDHLDPGKRRMELEDWLERDLEPWFQDHALPVTEASHIVGELY